MRFAVSVGSELCRRSRSSERTARRPTDDGIQNGYCDFRNKQIAVRPDVAPAQALKTLVHELGHALLHGDEVVRTREIQEVEVESVAFIVLDALGLSTDSYSFPYVARWTQGNVDLVKESAERSISCARQILAGLELGSSLLAVPSGSGMLFLVS